MERPRVLVVGQGVVLDSFGSEARNHLLFSQFVERKSGTGFRAVVEMGDVGHHSRIDLHLNVVRHIGDEEFLGVFVFKTHTSHITVGDDKSAKRKRNCGDDECAQEVGAQEAVETHACCLHRDNLRLACQSCGEKDNADENKHRRKHVGQVGDEVGIIVQPYLAGGSSAGGELVYLLVEVKDDGNHRKDGDEEHISGEKLAQDVAVNSLKTDEPKQGTSTPVEHASQQQHQEPRQPHQPQKPTQSPMAQGRRNCLSFSFARVQLPSLGGVFGVEFRSGGCGVFGVENRSFRL